MKSKSYIDDLILMNLLKNDSSNMVAQEVLKRYNKPFVLFFKKNKKVLISDIQLLFEKSLDLLIAEISNEKFVKIAEQTLFSLLLIKGCDLLKKPILKNKMKPYYLAGEVLIQLVLNKYSPCIDCIFKEYKDLTIALLTRHYDHCFNLPPQEIYGEAIMTLKTNIENGRLKTNLKSRLFTYFFLIARNKYLNLANHMKQLVFNPDIIKLESEFKTIKQEPSIINYIENYCPVIYPLIENSEKGVFQSLLTTFQKHEQELLRLRFEEGLRFSEIGKRLHLKEATCRKRLYDCLKKWKREFLKEEGANLIIQGDRYRA